MTQPGLEGAELWRGAMGISTAALLLALAALAPAVNAGTAQPLFDDTAPLAVTLEFSADDLRESATGGEPFEGRLSYEQDGRRQVFDLELSLRGHSRRELCEMPPLKLNFRQKQVEGTVFAGQNKLKLVTHCLDEGAFRRYLAQEYAVYRSYAALTDAAFRVRRLDVRYVDSSGFLRDKERPAFLIEADERVAERLGFEAVDTPSIDPAELDPGAITRLGLFQYMIGNTDWSLLKGRGTDNCCHNGLLLRTPDGGLVIVPYDFDQAGIINADYALPARELGLRSVRERLFRGLCTGEDRTESAITLFNERRPELEAAFPLEGRMKASNRRARRYLDDFFSIVNDPGQRRASITAQCRGDAQAWE